MIYLAHLKLILSPGLGKLLLCCPGKDQGGEAGVPRAARYPICTALDFLRLPLIVSDIRSR